MGMYLVEEEGALGRIESHLVGTERKTYKQLQVEAAK